MNRRNNRCWVINPMFVISIGPRLANKSPKNKRGTLSIRQFFCVFEKKGPPFYTFTAHVNALQTRPRVTASFV